YGYIDRGNLRGRLSALDVVQEVRYRCYRYFPNFRAKNESVAVGRLLCWIKQIAKTSYAITAKEQGVTLPNPDSEVVRRVLSREGSPSDQLRQREEDQAQAIQEAQALQRRRAEAIRVAKALKMMPEQRARVIWLRLFSKLSFKEIREISPKSDGTLPSEE